MKVRSIPQTGKFDEVLNFNQIFLKLNVWSLWHYVASQSNIWTFSSMIPQLFSWGLGWYISVRFYIAIPICSSRRTVCNVVHRLKRLISIFIVVYRSDQGMRPYLWALPTPQISLTVGLYWVLYFSHPVSNWVSPKLNCKIFKWSKWILFLLL